MEKSDEGGWVAWRHEDARLGGFCGGKGTGGRRMEMQKGRWEIETEFVVLWDIEMDGERQ